MNKPNIGLAVGLWIACTIVGGDYHTAYCADDGLPFAGYRHEREMYRDNVSRGLSISLTPKDPPGIPVKHISYFSAIKRQIELKCELPSSLVDKGTEWEVQVDLTTDASGRVLSVNLIKGSGDSAIDNAVETAVLHAGPVQPIPADLRASKLVLSVHFLFRQTPIIFR